MKTHIITELRKPEPKIRLVLATVVLGMGLNVQAVNHIIHLRPPTSLEKYMQESGRAGRGGQLSNTILQQQRHCCKPSRDVGPDETLLQK